MIATELITSSDLSAAVGVPYYRILYAHKTGALPEPAQRCKHFRMYTQEDVQRIKDYFAAKPVKKKLS